jgi:hypothetical protein
VGQSTDVALITGIFGSYEELRELPEHIEVDDAVCVTDDPDLTSETWRIVYEPRPAVHPNRAAKPPKMCPWRYTGCGSSVWIDAAYEVTDPGFPRWALGFATPFAVHAHPVRDCVYDEAVASMTFAKYAREPILEQVGAYRAAGHPEHWGLWENGCIARRHTAEAHALGEAWLDEIARWSFQDQISGPFLFRLHGLRPAVLPNEAHRLRHRPSRRHVDAYRMAG